MGRKAKGAVHVVPQEARRLVIEAMQKVEEVRLPRLKGQKIVLKSIKYMSGLSTAEASSALRWLRSVGAVGNEPGREGWKLLPLPKSGICWKHGTQLVKKHGAWVCTICSMKSAKSK